MKLELADLNIFLGEKFNESVEFPEYETEKFRSKDFSSLENWLQNAKTNNSAV